MAEFTNRVAIVTGSSSGIGEAIAKRLGALGATVVVNSATSVDAGTRVASEIGANATYIQADIADKQAGEKLIDETISRFGRLDILFHAGAVLGAMTPVSHVEPGLWDRVMLVNATASWRLIRSMEPLLKASEAGRAVFVTSSRAAAPRAFWGPYSASKAAMEAIIRAWADELENTGVRAALLDPGAMRTRMRAEAYPGEDPATLPEPSEIGPMVVELVLSDPGQPTEVRSFRAWKAARGSQAPSA